MVTTILDKVKSLFGRKSKDATITTSDTPVTQVTIQASLAQIVAQAAKSNKPITTSQQNPFSTGSVGTSPFAAGLLPNTFSGLLGDVQQKAEPTEEEKRIQEEEVRRKKAEEAEIQAQRDKLKIVMDEIKEVLKQLAGEELKDFEVIFKLYNASSNQKLTKEDMISVNEIYNKYRTPHISS